MVTRRKLLAGLGVSGLLASTGTAIAGGFLGGVNASSEGLRAGSPDDQGKVLQKILDNASKGNQAVFIEPGRYSISNVVLPKNTRLYGINGASVFDYAGGDHFIYCENADHIELEGLVLDGGLLPLKEYANAALRINDTKYVSVENCHITNSSQVGFELDRSAGRVARNRIDTAVGDAGFFGLENTGVTISENLVEECANAGIMIYRWSRGEDNTMVANNRVRLIAAVKGGTGPYGNGINTYQSDGVIVTDNHVSDCAFSTIRSNSCSNIQITNNTCLRAGETSIYSEFEFQGAMISGNIVDGAARGISIANLDKGGRLSVCSGNLVRNIHESIPYKDDEGHIFGAGILAEADISITGNVVERTARFGVLLGWGNYLRNVIASNNMIRDTKTGFYVSVVEGTGDVSITNNIIARAEQGIVGYRWNEAVSDDLTKNSTTRFSGLTIAGNQVS